jgi:adenosylcobyric acid synthase
MGNRKVFKKPLMFVGTNSSAGKSFMVAALSRILKLEGFDVAPFKAQNMSLNSFVTLDGKEMARAQVFQAFACGIEPEVQMNPILLKPQGDSVSQLIVDGRPVGNYSSKDFYERSLRDRLFGHVLEAFNYLSERYNPIVIEGAGSISELNLKDKDIVNLNLAKVVDADVYLVADIDRGGVFGSVYGNIALLKGWENKLIKGVIVNRFRGDIKLFEEGVNILERITGKKVVGVVPFIDGLYLEEEDSLNRDERDSFEEGKLKIAIIKLKHLSNFTDFDHLFHLQDISLLYTDRPEKLLEADVIIIPGSKSTIKDLRFLKQSGLFEIIKRHHLSGKMVVGICGGFQMMGEKVCDPYKIESDYTEEEGLAIFPVTTVLEKEKLTKRVEFKFLNYEQLCYGYEIHNGITEYKTDKFLCRIKNGDYDGTFVNKSFGTYIHGILDNEVVVRYILSLHGYTLNRWQSINELKNRSLDKMAEVVKKHLDMEYIYKMAGVL